MIAGAFLFGIQVYDYFTTPKGGNKKTRTLRKGDIKYYRKRRKLPHSSGHLHLAEKVSLIFRTQKNGVKNATVTQWRPGKHLCIVQLWVYIVTSMDLYPGSSDETLVNTV